MGLFIDAEYLRSSPTDKGHMDETILGFNAACAG